MRRRIGGGTSEIVKKSLASMNVRGSRTNEGVWARNRSRRPRRRASSGPVADQIEWRTFDLDGLIEADSSGASDLGRDRADGSDAVLRRDRVARAAAWPAGVGPPGGCWRQGCTARARIPARRGTWRGCASATMPHQWIWRRAQAEATTRSSDFRVEHGDKLDTLLIGDVGDADGVQARDVAAGGAGWDGGCVRAPERRRFSRASTLRERCLVEAQEQAATLRRELEQDPAGRRARGRRRRGSEPHASGRRRSSAPPRSCRCYAGSARAHAAKAGHARRVAKARAADEDAKKSERERERRAKSQHHRPRGARVMKMADGGLPSCVQSAVCDRHGHAFDRRRRGGQRGHRQGADAADGRANPAAHRQAARPMPGRRRVHQARGHRRGRSARHPGLCARACRGQSAGHRPLRAKARGHQPHRGLARAYEHRRGPADLQAARRRRRAPCTPTCATGEGSDDFRCVAGTRYGPSRC